MTFLSLHRKRWLKYFLKCIAEMARNRNPQKPKIVNIHGMRVGWASPCTKCFVHIKGLSLRNTEVATYPHFTDVKTEAQEGSETCPRSYS